jgi:hypothetical protein
MRTKKQVEKEYARVLAETEIVGTIDAVMHCSLLIAYSWVLERDEKAAEHSLDLLKYIHMRVGVK